MICRESPLFQTLEAPMTPWNRWATSLVVHMALVVLLLAIPLGVSKTLQSHQAYVRLELIAPRLTPPPAKQTYRRATVNTPPHVAQKVKFQAPVEIPRIKRPAVEVARIEPVKIEPTKIELPKIELAKIEALSTPAPKSDLPAPALKPAVKTGLFAENQPAVVAPQPSRQVKPGGFGDPNGVRPSATSSGKGLMLAQTGAFDLPPGSGAGRGGGGRTRVLASAGFGDAGASGGNQPGGSLSGRGAGPVRSGGFGDYRTSPAPARVTTASAPVSTPVEIISKPKPVYTPEARVRGVEGEVQLDVLFRASGQVEVLRVIRGLGLGLDGAATTAASQIRFRPGTRDGNPADMRGIVHIVFQLS
jgi:TonB family protein